MEINEFEKIARAFGLSPQKFSFQTFGSGHINQTYLLSNLADNQYFILQAINNSIFKNPETIAHNWHLAQQYLAKNQPDYYFIQALQTIEGDFYFYDENKKPWRIMPYVANSFTYDTLENATQAHEAAIQFARLSCLLAGVDITQFQASIPDFHNLSLRYQQFLEALENASETRKLEANEVIEYLLSLQNIVLTFEKIQKNEAIKLRIMHHDTKINNILFDKSILEFRCIVDLDTLMPGYFISDLGDMLRTCLSSSAEDEPLAENIEVRDNFFEAIIAGYIGEIKDFLTEAEKELIFYAGEFMIYMQALRFLSDYLNNDIYYKIHYPQQNLHRASNQVHLLKKYLAKKADYQTIIQKYL